MKKRERAASRVRDLLGAHRDAADLLKIGAYVQGSDPRVDAAVKAMPEIESLVRQDLEEPSTRDLAIARVMEIAEAS